jgi:hypothetical protein
MIATDDVLEVVLEVVLELLKSELGTYQDLFVGI